MKTNLYIITIFLVASLRCTYAVIAGCQFTNYIGPTLSFPLPIHATITLTATNAAESNDYDPGIIYLVDFNTGGTMMLMAPRGFRTTNDYNRYLTQASDAAIAASMPLHFETNDLRTSIVQMSTNEVRIGIFNGFLISATMQIPNSTSTISHRSYILYGNNLGIYANISGLNTDIFDHATALIQGVERSLSEEK
jgi:hypothetical protein